MGGRRREQQNAASHSRNPAIPFLYSAGLERGGLRTGPMKRIRLERLGGQLLSPRKNTRPCCLRLRNPPSTRCLASSFTHQQIRSQSSFSSPISDEVVYEDGEASEIQPLGDRHPSSPYPSPLPDAASLPEARLRASVNALKAWYLYSPGNNVPVPSDTESANARPWEPVHIDIGEVIH